MPGFSVRNAAFCLASAYNFIFSANEMTTGSPPVPPKPWQVQEVWGRLYAFSERILII
jgi:hypothetical protein